MSLRIHVLLWTFFLSLLGMSQPTQSEHPTPRRRLVSFERAAQHAGKHERTVRRWVERGYLAAYKVGARDYAIDLSELDALIREASSSAIHVSAKVPFGPKARVVDLSKVVLPVDAVER